MLHKLGFLSSPAQELFIQDLQKGHCYQLVIEGFQTPSLNAIHGGLKKPNGISNFCNKQHKTIF